jgi:REP element-mobilizing transposase RayT
MNYEPIYTPDNTNPAYQLNWALTLFWRDSPLSDDDWLPTLKTVAEPDGVRILKHEVRGAHASHFFVSTQPHVAPSALIRSVKGRLQHAIRSDVPKAFQRNYWLHSIGSAKRETVEDYVATQLGHHPMADSAVQARLARFQKTFPDVDLSQRRSSGHGQFWYNLHIVFVNDGRWMEVADKRLGAVSEMLEKVARKYGHLLSRATVLPDHAHLTVGCPIDSAPQDVVLCYMNNCAYALGMRPEFQFSYYAGTVGEYDLGAVS